MGARVANANHLGATLRLNQARPPTPTEALRDAFRPHHRVACRRIPEPSLDEAAHQPADPKDLTDLQQQVLAAKKRIRAEGLPEGQP